MLDQEVVQISRKELRGFQLNSWLCSVLLGGLGLVLANKFAPGLGYYVHVPVGMLLMSIPMLTYLRLERRRRGLAELKTLRYVAAVFAGIVTAAVVAFGLENLF